MKASTIVDAAQSLLALMVEQLEPIPGFNLPAARFVAPGAEVAMDGESLAVYLGDIGQGQPGLPFSGTYMPASVTNLRVSFYVQILREVAALNGAGGLESMMPSVEQQMASALVTINDAEQLLKAAVAIHSAYTFTGPGEGFVIGPVVPVGPEGALVGSRLILDVSVT